MKTYIKLITILLFAVATLSAQQKTSLNNPLPETWKPDFSNSYLHKTVTPRQIQHQYTPTEFSKGRQYNVINTKTRVNTPTSFNIQYSNNGHYHSYSINHNDAQNVTYNALAQVKPIATIDAVEATPFDDVVATGDIMLVDRYTKPNDPAPINDVALPLLLIAIAYMAIKLRK